MNLVSFKLPRFRPAVLRYFSAKISDQTHIKSNSGSYARLLQDCVDTKSLEQGKRVHTHIIKSGHDTNVFVRNHLINMYVKCGSAEFARQVFDNMWMRNLFSWNTMITGYARDCLLGEKALLLFCEMQHEGVGMDRFTLSSALTVCATMAALEPGRQLHSAIIRHVFELDVVAGTALVDMYGKCGKMKDAWQVFGEMPQRNVVTWSVIMQGCAHNECFYEAFELFLELRLEGVKPDQVLFSIVLSVCAGLTALKQGKQVHSFIVKTGFESHVVVGSALVDMYGKCERVEDARQAFDGMCEWDEVSWSAMIVGYVQNGHDEEALELFRQMQLNGIKPEQFVFSSVLSACASLAALEQGMCIHGSIVKAGLESCTYVGNAIVDMYGKCGSIKDACQAFDMFPNQTVDTMNSMISGYTQNGCFEEACMLFWQVQQAGMRPNQFTLASVLKSCASLAALERGKQVHSHALKTGSGSEVFVESALVNMYAKSGCIEDAQQVFDRMDERNVVSWNAIIAAYAYHGLGREALKLFEQMQQARMKPNSVTFLCVLVACGHTGMVNEGYVYFQSMKEDHGIAPRLEHYACMVDLLGRAGLINEAEDLIEVMPLEPDALLWGSLLSACRIYGNVSVAKRAAECLLDLEPGNAGAYVQMSNIYAAFGRWDDVRKMRKMMRDFSVEKEPGCSWIEIKNKIHAFIVEERMHPQMEEIFAM